MHVFHCIFLWQLHIWVFGLSMSEFSLDLKIQCWFLTCIREMWSWFFHICVSVPMWCYSQKKSCMLFKYVSYSQLNSDFWTFLRDLLFSPDKISHIIRASKQPPENCQFPGGQTYNLPEFDIRHLSWILWKKHRIVKISNIWRVISRTWCNFRILFFTYATVCTYRNIILNFQHSSWISHRKKTSLNFQV